MLNYEQHFYIKKPSVQLITGGMQCTGPLAFSPGLTTATITTVTRTSTTEPDRARRCPGQWWGVLYQSKGHIQNEFCLKNGVGKRCSDLLLISST